MSAAGGALTQKLVLRFGNNQTDLDEAITGLNHRLSDYYSRDGAKIVGEEYIFPAVSLNLTVHISAPSTEGFFSKAASAITGKAGYHERTITITYSTPSEENIKIINKALADTFGVYNTVDEKAGIFQYGTDSVSYDMYRTYGLEVKAGGARRRKTRRHRSKRRSTHRRRRHH